MENKMDTDEKSDSVELIANEDIEDSEEDSEMLGPLKILSTTLNKRIRVSTSIIQLNPNDPNSIEFVAVEGFNDPETLRCLEESVSDIISLSEDRRSIGSSGSKTSSERRTASTTFDDPATTSASSTGPEESSSKTTGSFDSIPSVTSSFDGTVEPESLESAEEAIADLEKNGPAGLVHLSSLSDAVGKPIRIWSSGSESSKKVGRTRTGEAVDVEYHEPGPGEIQGHWTLPGNREPRDVAGQLNDCLFCVVADQTGHLAPELRDATIRRMRKNIRSLANRIEKIAKLEKCDRISLLIGGARYNGNRPQDAGRVIDQSQQGRCHPSGMQGHPRGHASHPEATGPTDSAENYSRTGMKSAFLSRLDQDAVGHLVLKTPQAQQAMAQLNSGETNCAIRVNRGELSPGPLPMAVEFYQGQRQGDERPIREFVIVLRHHVGQQNNPEADVFVHTFYPVLQ